MRSVYVITHPEATHHVERVVGGWHDSQLTPTGIRAAVSIAEALRAGIPDDAEVEVITSDLRRARRTADETAKSFCVQPIEDRRLRERSYGEAEGRPQEWLDQRFVPPPAIVDRMGHDVGVQGAETTRAFARRVYAAMNEILCRPYQHQIIVTHGGALTFVVACWIGMPIESLGHVNFSGVLRQHHHIARRRLLSQPPGRQPRRHPPSQLMSSGVLKIFIHRS